MGYQVNSNCLSTKLYIYIYRHIHSVVIGGSGELSGCGFYLLQSWASENGQMTWFVCTVIIMEVWQGSTTRKLSFIAG